MAKKINKEQCIGCSTCVEACPFGAISYFNKLGGDDYWAYIDPEKCVECDVCERLCPIGIISLDENTPHRRHFRRLEIDPEKCIGCSLCKRACPVHAIDGVIRQPFTVAQDLCIKCGVCLSKCKKDAFLVAYID